MTVYIEYVIIDNVIIDYLMMKATFSLTGLPFRKGRLFLCSILGAVIALIYPLLSHVKPLMIAVKVLSGLLIMLLSNKFNSVKSYYINTLIFFTFTFITGGAIMGIFSLFNLDYSAEYSVCFMAVPVYFIICGTTEIIKYIYRRKDKIHSLYKVEIRVKNKTCTTTGFMDTGNGVYDGINPVIFCDKQFFLRSFGKELPMMKFKKIPVFTVNGKSEKIGVKVNEIKIYIHNKVNIINNVTLCILSENTCEWDIILHPGLLEEKDGIKVVEETEKVS